MCYKTKTPKTFDFRGSGTYSYLHLRIYIFVPQPLFAHVRLSLPNGLRY